MYGQYETGPWIGYHTKEKAHGVYGWVIYYDNAHTLTQTLPMLQVCCCYFTDIVPLVYITRLSQMNVAQSSTKQDRSITIQFTDTV